MERTLSERTYLKIQAVFDAKIPTNVSWPRGARVYPLHEVNRGYASAFIREQSETYNLN